MRASIAALACIACTGGGAGPSSFEPPSPGATTIGQAVEIDDPSSAPQTVANIVYDKRLTDLIVNGDFEDYGDPNVPAGWSVDEIYGWRGMYGPTDGWRGGAVQFVRNAQGRHLLAPVSYTH